LDHRINYFCILPVLLAYAEALLNQGNGFSLRHGVQSAGTAGGGRDHRVARELQPMIVRNSPDWLDRAL
jgi:hypothetical protein